MGENIIKARQTAKIATSSEWEDSTLPLKRGELAINETTGEMRFGDGVDTFNNSPKVKTVPLSHSSSSTEYGVGNGENYGHVKLSDSTDSTSDVSDGTAATPAAVKAAYDLANSKAGKENDSGGFMGGRSANVIDYGGAIGAYSYTESGGAVGDTAKSSTGGAVGEVAESTGGAAVGYATITSNGVAVGMNATTVDSDGNGIDAIQLGTGTNSTEKTIQVYNYQLMDANGKIPADRLSPHASTSNTYGVGNSSSYGHLKLSSSTSSTSGTTSGIAATPSAVKAAYDKANIRKNTSSTTGDIITTHLTVGSRLADSSFGGSSLVTGQNNIASGDKTASIGGDYNTASGYCAATIGGSNVSVSSNYSGSIGGFSTTVTGAYSSIVGGSNNSVNGDNAAVVGGDGNTASGDRSVVIGGNDNTASGNNNSVVVGGYNNTASGESSITLGGNNNTASAYQTKVGHYSKTGNAGQGSGTSGDAFIVGNGSSITRSNAFRVAYSGSVYALSAFNSTGADYAELLEWEDGNTDNEDRRGLFVTWGANDKIKIANAGDEIVGIVSATSSVIGNAYEDSWQGMYLTDAFGQPITQIVHHDAEYADVEVPDIDEHGNILDTTHTEQQLLREAYDAEEYAVNPDYDPAQEYIPRSQRREWAKVGMLGQLIVIDDGTCTVGSRCTVGDNGKAVASEEGYRVMERIDETHIKIFFK